MHDFELLVFIIWIAGTTIKDVIDSKIGLMLFSGEILQKKPQKCLKCHTPYSSGNRYLLAWYFDLNSVKSTRQRNVSFSRNNLNGANTATIFRQIDLQYNSLVKKLTWLNFCKKSWGKNFQISTLCFLDQCFRAKIPRNQRFYYTVHSMENGPKTLSRFLTKSQLFSVKLKQNWQRW